MSKLGKYILFILAITTFTIISTSAVLTYKEPSDWESVDELQEFLNSEQNNQVVKLKADENGQISFWGQCEDLSFNLRDNAMKIGKRIETEILFRSECIKYQKFLGIGYENAHLMNTNDSHMICKAFIGNEIWYIEPLSLRILHIGYLD